MLDVLALMFQWRLEFAKNEHLLWQIIEGLMERKEGFEALTATGDIQTVHLDCAVQYQAMHGASADLQSMASKVLSQLRSTTGQQGLKP